MGQRLSLWDVLVSVEDKSFIKGQKDKLGNPIVYKVHLNGFILVQ